MGKRGQTRKSRLQALGEGRRKGTQTEIKRRDLSLSIRKDKTAEFKEVVLHLARIPTVSVEQQPRQFLCCVCVYVCECEETPQPPQLCV